MQKSAKKPKSTTYWISAFAALMAPITATLLLGFSALSRVMIQTPPAAITAKLPSPKPLTHPHRALILLGNRGTELTEFLAPYEIFARSGQFDVFTAAPLRRLSMTSAAVSVLPDYDLKSAPPADVLVIPAMLNATDDALIAWVRANAPRFRVVVSLCEGARLAAAAGILEGRRATSHFLALPDLAQSYPGVHWVSGERVVEDGSLISSAGVTAAIDASFSALARISGRALAEKTARGLSYDWDPGAYRRDPPSVGWGEWAGFFLKTAYDWDRSPVSVQLSPGVDEISLAAQLETLTRSFHFHVSTAAERELVQTRSGLWLSPLPGSDSPERVITPSADAPGKAFDRSLRAIPSPVLVAKLIEYPHAPPRAPQSLGWLYRPALIALLGLLLARIFLRRRPAAIGVT